MAQLSPPPVSLLKYQTFIIVIIVIKSFHTVLNLLSFVLPFFFFFEAWVNGFGYCLHLGTVISATIIFVLCSSHSNVTPGHITATSINECHLCCSSPPCSCYHINYVILAVFLNLRMRNFSQSLEGEADLPIILREMFVCFSSMSYRSNTQIFPSMFFSFVWNM